MTDSDDDLKRRYREFAREEPPSAIDAAILAKALQKVETKDAPSSSAPAGKEGASLVSGSFRRWSVPLSLAAVLMMGIGVSLRMQLERPGVETSIAASESSPPPPAAPAPATPAVTADHGAANTLAESPVTALEEKKVAPVQAQRKAEVRTPPQAFARDQAATATSEKTAAQGITAPIVAAPSPAAAPPPPPAPAPKEPAENAPRPDANYAPLQRHAAEPAAPPADRATAPSAAVSGLAASASERGTATPGAPAAASAPATAPQRAKRKAESDAASGAAELRKRSLIAPADRELVRIAQLREAGKHEEADKALEEFRKRFPDHRINEVMWERVKAR